MDPPRPVASRPDPGPGATVDARDGSGGTPPAVRDLRVRGDTRASSRSAPAGGIEEERERGRRGRRRGPAAGRAVRTPPPTRRPSPPPRSSVRVARHALG